MVLSIANKEEARTEDDGYSQFAAKLYPIIQKMQGIAFTLVAEN
jgi:hypothetical protein